MEMELAALQTYLFSEKLLGLEKYVLTQGNDQHRDLPYLSDLSLIKHNLLINIFVNYKSLIMQSLPGELAEDSH